MQLNKKQQKLFNQLETDEQKSAFLALCEANGRKWLRVLLDQFGTDANVSGINKDLLGFIRSIRNDTSIDWSGIWCDI